MKKSTLHVKTVLSLILLFIPFLLSGQVSASAEKESNATVRYIDGIWEGKSQSEYSVEPYWGIVKLTVKNGILSGIEFKIRDSLLHETFDEKYERHFQGNPLYIDQCRNDWKGVRTYPVKLSETQNINKVDAMTGATWSCNIFKASVNEALKASKSKNSY